MVIVEKINLKRRCWWRHANGRQIYHLEAVIKWKGQFCTPMVLSWVFVQHFSSIGQVFLALFNETYSFFYFQAVPILRVKIFYKHLQL